MLEAFGCTDPGPRGANEDAFLFEPDVGLFLVADGMGGHAAGEVASELAIQTVAAHVRRSSDTGEVSWPCGIERSLSYNGNRLRTAVYLANRRVLRAAESHDEYTGMGTTIVAALVADGYLVVGHVGDSRLYILRDGVLTQVTRDDSWAATILGASKGGTSAAMPARAPMRHVLTNALGVREQAEIHISEHALTGGEVLLLCTDGLHTVLDHDQLAAALLRDDDLETQARGLVRAALSGGARDNVTALVVANRA